MHNVRRLQVHADGPTEPHNRKKRDPDTHH